MVLDTNQIRDYFLGKLSSEDTERIESACFNDQAFAESVFVIEENLIDQYVVDELSHDERERFEQVYLTTKARRAKLDVARMLNHQSVFATEAQGESKAAEGFNPIGWLAATFGGRVSRFAFATILLGAVILAVWLLLGAPKRELVTRTNAPTNFETTPEPSVTPSPVTNSPTPQSSDEVATPGPSKFATAVFTLYAGALRSGGASEQLVKLARQTQNVELRLILQDQSNQSNQSYNIQIETAEGEAVVERKNVKATLVDHHRVLTVHAAASRLPDRDYIARVVEHGGEPAASYAFRLTRKN
jgi:hypothetical protein